MIGVDPDNLAYQVLMADVDLVERNESVIQKVSVEAGANGLMSYQLVHGNTNQFLGNHDGAEVPVSFRGRVEGTTLSRAAPSKTDPEIE